MPGNFRIHLAPYQPDIPDACFSDVTAALRTRLSLDGGLARCMCVATATTQGNLMIFSERRLLKSCQLPFRDCCQILLYHCFEPGITKEFLVALSFTKGAVVIDLQMLSVVKAWPNAKKVEIKDEHLLGYPQVVVYFQDDLGEKIVVSQESGWAEIVSQDQPLSLPADESALKNVVLALETQLRSVQGNLFLMEKQISLRQSIVNRSLTALNDTVMCKATRKQAPTYTSKWNKGENAENSTPELFQDSESPSIVEVCGMWHFMDHLSGSWIVGAAFTNKNDKTLCDIQCFFMSKKENANYRIFYYRTDSKVLSSFPSNGFSALLATSITFNGKLEPNCGLVVIVTTSIPRFVNTEEEIGSLFLTCKLSAPVKPFQLNLGCVRLKFNDVCNQTIKFDPSNHDVMALRRNILGLVSLVAKEETLCLSTTVSSAFRSFKKAAKQMEMQHLTPMQCFYSLGFCGHIFVLVLENSPNQVQIQIRAQCERKLQWFIHQLKSVLSDDCVFAHVTENSKRTEQTFSTNPLHTVISLLSNAEVSEDDEPVMIEEAATPLNSALDTIRKEFLRKQGKILGMARGQPGCFKIPIEHYRKWQDNFFV